MLTMPIRMLLLAIAGWLNEEQRERIEFLQEQVRVLQELQGGKRLRLTDDQRRRLAAKGKRLGRRVLRATSHNNIGNVQEAQGDLTSALASYRAGMAIRAGRDPRLGPARDRKKSPTRLTSSLIVRAE